MITQEQRKQAHEITDQRIKEYDEQTELLSKNAKIDQPPVDYLLKIERNLKRLANELGMEELEP